MNPATARARAWRRRYLVASVLALAALIALAAARLGRDSPPALPDPAGGRTVPVVLNGSCPTPVYPEAAAAQKESGVVMLNFLIGPDGTIIDSRVETSSGHAALDDAARAALSHCRFRPGTVNGKPEASWHIMKHVWIAPR